MSAGRTQDRPRGWPLAPATVRAVLSGHGILGLAFAAVIFLVCLTGTLAVFVHDLERWEQPGLPRVDAIAPAVLERAVTAARAGSPAQTTFYIGLPSATEPGASIIAYRPTEERAWMIAPDGALAAKRTPFADFLLDLHIALHLPRSWGGFVVGLAGVALLSSLVSGILAHPRIFKDAFHLRLGGARRLQEADVHNRLGIWALPFHLTIALTGALLGLSTLIVGVLAMLLYRGDSAKVYALFVDPPPAVDATPAPPTPLGPLLAEAQGRAPGATPRQIVVERLGRADARVTITSERDRLLVPQDTTSFDTFGRVVKDQHPADLAAGTRILGGIGQLHFGWFGGLPVRLLYGLLGLATCVVTSSGVTIWLARRRDKGRPVPRWERLWSATVWGQPLALLLAALVAAIGATVPPVWIWLAAAIVLLAGAGVSTLPAILLSQALRLAVALTAILLGLIHLIREPYELTGLAIDALLLVGGIAIIAQQRRGTAA
jgi:uncharacterized iron-regulated membrane protein